MTFTPSGQRYIHGEEANDMELLQALHGYAEQIRSKQPVEDKELELARRERLRDGRQLRGGGRSTGNINARREANKLRAAIRQAEASGANPEEVLRLQNALEANIRGRGEGRSTLEEAVEAIQDRLLIAIEAKDQVAIAQAKADLELLQSTPLVEGPGGRTKVGPEAEGRSELSEVKKKNIKSVGTSGRSRADLDIESQNPDANIIGPDQSALQNVGGHRARGAGVSAQELDLIVKEQELAKIRQPSAEIGVLGSPERPDLRTPQGVEMYYNLLKSEGRSLNQIMNRIQELAENGIYDPVAEDRKRTEFGQATYKVPAYEDGKLGEKRDYFGKDRWIVPGFNVEGKGAQVEDAAVRLMAGYRDKQGRTISYEQALMMLEDRAIELANARGIDLDQARIEVGLEHGGDNGIRVLHQENNQRQLLTDEEIRANDRLMLKGGPRQDLIPNKKEKYRATNKKGKGVEIRQYWKRGNPEDSPRVGKPRNFESPMDALVALQEGVASGELSLDQEIEIGGNDYMGKQVVRVGDVIRNLEQRDGRVLREKDLLEGRDLVAAEAARRDYQFDLDRDADVFTKYARQVGNRGGVVLPAIESRAQQMAEREGISLDDARYRQTVQALQRGESIGLEGPGIAAYDTRGTSRLGQSLIELQMFDEAYKSKLSELNQGKAALANFDLTPDELMVAERRYRERADELKAERDAIVGSRTEGLGLDVDFSDKQQVSEYLAVGGSVSGGKRSKEADQRILDEVANRSEVNRKLRENAVLISGAGGDSARARRQNVIDLNLQDANAPNANFSTQALESRLFGMEGSRGLGAEPILLDNRTKHERVGVGENVILQNLSGDQIKMVYRDDVDLSQPGFNYYDPRSLDYGRDEFADMGPRQQNRILRERDIRNKTKRVHSVGTIGGLSPAGRAYAHKTPVQQLALRPQNAALVPNTERVVDGVTQSGFFDAEGNELYPADVTQRIQSPRVQAADWIAMNLENKYDPNAGIYERDIDRVELDDLEIPDAVIMAKQYEVAEGLQLLNQRLAKKGVRIPEGGINSVMALEQAVAEFAQAKFDAGEKGWRVYDGELDRELRAQGKSASGAYRRLNVAEAMKQFKINEGSEEAMKMANALNQLELARSHNVDREKSLAEMNAPAIQQISSMNENNKLNIAQQPNQFGPMLPPALGPAAPTVFQRPDRPILVGPQISPMEKEVTIARAGYQAVPGRGGDALKAGALAVQGRRNAAGQLYKDILSDEEFKRQIGVARGNVEVGGQQYPKQLKQAFRQIDPVARIREEEAIALRQHEGNPEMQKQIRAFADMQIRDAMADQGNIGLARQQLVGKLEGEEAGPRDKGMLIVPGVPDPSGPDDTRSPLQRQNAAIVRQAEKRAKDNREAKVPRRLIRNEGALVAPVVQNMLRNRTLNSPAGNAPLTVQEQIASQPDAYYAPTDMGSHARRMFKIRKDMRDRLRPQVTPALPPAPEGLPGQGSGVAVQDPKSGRWNVIGRDNKPYRDHLGRGQLSPDGGSIIPLINQGDNAVQGRDEAAERRLMRAGHENRLALARQERETYNAPQVLGNPGGALHDGYQQGRSTGLQRVEPMPPNDQMKWVNDPAFDVGGRSHLNVQGPAKGNPTPGPRPRAKLEQAAQGLPPGFDPIAAQANKREQEKRAAARKQEMQDRRNAPDQQVRYETKGGTVNLDEDQTQAQTQKPRNRIARRLGIGAAVLGTGALIGSELNRRREEEEKKERELVGV